MRKPVVRIALQTVGNSRTERQECQGRPRKLHRPATHCLPDTIHNPARSLALMQPLMQSHMQTLNRASTPCSTQCIDSRKQHAADVDDACGGSARRTGTHGHRTQPLAVNHQPPAVSSAAYAAISRPGGPLSAHLKHSPFNTSHAQRCHPGSHPPSASSRPLTVALVTPRSMTLY